MTEHRNRHRTNKYKTEGNEHKGKHPAIVTNNLLTFSLGSDAAIVYIEVREQLLIEALLLPKYSEDIATLLQTDQELDLRSEMPKVEVVRETDPDIRAARLLEVQQKYRLDYDFFKKRLEQLKQNKNNMCALIMKRCNQELRDRLQTKPGYNTFTLSDPLKFLAEIKTECLAYGKTDYGLAVQERVIREMFNIEQYEHESVGNYARRAKALWEELCNSMEWKYTRYNNSLKGFSSKDETLQNRINANTHERLFAFILITHADKSRYGEMIENMERQYAVGTKQYPATFEDARLILEKTAKCHKQRKKNHDSENPKKKPDVDDEKEGILETSFATAEIQCDVCGKTGHATNRCYKRNKLPKEEWFINTVHDKDGTKSITSKQPKSQNEDNVQEEVNLVECDLKWSM
jgi:hypothetical protein